MSFKILILILFLVAGDHCFAAKSYEVLEVSSSGESLVLDKGQFEGVELKQYVMFLKNIGTIDDPKIVRIGNGEAIKVNDVNSYWLIRNRSSKYDVKKGENLIVVGLDEVMNKRSPIRSKQTKVVLDDSYSVKSYKKDKEQGVPGHLVFKGKDLYRAKKDFKDDRPIEADIEIREYEKISKSKKASNTKVFSRGDLIESQRLRKKEKRKIFNSTLKGVTKKFSGKKGDFKNLYREQKRSKGYVQFKEGIDSENIYEYYQSKAKEDLIPLRVYERKKKEGPLFTAGMSDQDLRRYIVKTGIVAEEFRQKRSLTTKTGNELILSYSAGLANNTGPEDPTFSARSSEFSIGYEFHLMRILSSLKNWSIDFYGEKGTDYADVGGINAQFSYTSFSAGINWYFINNPAALNTYMWYLGLGIKRGNAVAHSPNLTRDYEFQTTGLTNIYVGTKYRFLTGDSYSDDVKVGLALNLRFSLGPVSYTSKDIIVDDIESNISQIDYKLRIGMSLYF